MEYRRLGKSSLVVSGLGLGCMGMSEFYGPTNDRESTDTIRHAIDIGVTLLDTADMYGVGRNEELVGKAIEKHRHEVIVATKFGNVRANPADAPRSPSIRKTLTSTRSGLASA